jgi:hypothetical protein
MRSPHLKKKNKTLKCQAFQTKESEEGFTFPYTYKERKRRLEYVKLGKEAGKVM